MSVHLLPGRPSTLVSLCRIRGVPLDLVYVRYLVLRLFVGSSAVVFRGYHTDGYRRANTPNQAMKPTAPDRTTASVFAGDAARGLSLSR